MYLNTYKFFILIREQDSAKILGKRAPIFLVHQSLKHKEELSGFQGEELGSSCCSQGHCGPQRPAQGSAMLPELCLESKLNSRRAVDPGKWEAGKKMLEWEQEHKEGIGGKAEVTYLLKWHWHPIVMTVPLHIFRGARWKQWSWRPPRFFHHRTETETQASGRRVRNRACFKHSSALGYRLILFA